MSRRGGQTGPISQTFPSQLVVLPGMLEFDPEARSGPGGENYHDGKVTAPEPRVGQLPHSPFLRQIPDSSDSQFHLEDVLVAQTSTQEAQENCHSDFHWC